jgi:hypothetical protein
LLSPAGFREEEEARVNYLSINLVLLMAALTATGCMADRALDGEPTREASLGGKADTFDPPWVGNVYWGTRRDVSFRDFATDATVFAVHMPFETFGPAKVTFETMYHDTMVDEWDALNAKIDTVAYIYRAPTADGRWGRNLASDDDGGDDHFSKLTVELPDAGSYRLVVRRRFEPAAFPSGYTPIIDVQSQCDGEGCSAPTAPARVCESDTDWACVIGQAVVLGDGPDVRVTHTVAVEDLTGELRAAVAAAVTEIEERSFAGTDYTAEVEGIYAIHRSSSDATIVAYAVLGYGSGEPDYSDAVLIGLSPSGARVYSDELDW